MQRQKQNNSALWLVLGGAFVLRMLLATVTKGYPYDMSCFVAWGEKLLADGPAGFYSDGYFADYPPGYLLVLGLVALVRRIFAIPYEAKLTYVLLAVVPSLCDCAAAALVWKIGQEKLPGSRLPLLLAAFVAFDPLLLFDSAVWKQIDGAFALPLLLCFYLLEKRRYLPAALLFGTALAIKPQALLFGPVLAVCFLAAIVQEKNRFRAFLRCFGGAALALLPPLVLGLPFFGAANLLPGLLEKYAGTAASYPYATINGFNWLAALGGNWTPLENPVLLGITWKQLGFFNILLVTLGLVYLAARSVRAGRFSPLLLAAYYGLGIFTLAHCMHERYMVPGVVLTLLAAARWDDIRLFAVGFGMSLTGFINLCTVYSLTGSDDEWLTSATSSSVTILVGLAETVCFVLLLFAVWDIVANGHTLPLPARMVEAAAPPAAPAPQPKWQRKEILALLALTAATAVVSFAYLGSRTAPQNPLDATGTTLTETVTAEGGTAALWVYPGISYGGRLTVADAAGTTLYEKELDYSTCFSWTSVELYADAGEVFHITVENAQVFELALRSADGVLVPVTGGGALFDEQDAVPEAISQLNSMYFDEIYHGRTGYEQLHRLPVYETTHPPLGKDFIMLGIALFGMTAFGWRFAGTLTGILMIPAIYLLAMQLMKRTRWAALSALLLTADCMHFTQTRIATIDSFPVLFMMVMFLFMARWMQMSFYHQKLSRTFIPLGLSGVFMGLAISSKWIGCYGAVGLAVLFFSRFIALYKQSRYAQKHREENPAFAHAADSFVQKGALTIAACIVFFVLVPVTIYVMSYIPYLSAYGEVKLNAKMLERVWNAQVTMFEYHKNLVATHYFSSPWYEWPLIIKPMWYYSAAFPEAGKASTIMAFGNPAVWWTGLLGILFVLGYSFYRNALPMLRVVPGRDDAYDRAMPVIAVGFLSAYLPWVLVSRLTFIYHYFASVPFIIMATAWWLDRLPRSRPRLRMGVMALYLVGALVFFVMFFPYASGWLTSTGWLDAMKWFSKLYY